MSRTIGLFTMEGGDSEFVNFTLPTLKTFLEAHSQNVSGKKQNTRFPQTCDLLVSQKMMQTLFSPPSIPLPRSFLQLQHWQHLHCFTILGSTSTVIHSVKQQISPEVMLRSLATSCVKDYKGHSLLQTSFTEPPNSQGGGVEPVEH